MFADGRVSKRGQRGREGGRDEAAVGGEKGAAGRLEVRIRAGRTRALLPTRGTFGALQRVTLGLHLSHHRGLAPVGAHGSRRHDDVRGGAFDAPRVMMNDGAARLILLKRRWDPPTCEMSASDFESRPA